MKAKIAVVIFSLLVLAGVVLFMLLDERNFTLVAMAPTATRTPTKTPRLTRTLVPTNTPVPPPTRTASPPTPTPLRPPTAEVSSTAFTPQPPPSPQLPPTVIFPPTSIPSPTKRPSPTQTPQPSPTLIPLKQFTGNDPKWFWNSAYSPNCGSMGIGKLYSRVLDTKGKPVAGVVIRLWWPDARPDEYMDSTPTGNDGSFEIAFAGPPRDFTAYVAVHAHWGNPVESSEVLTIQFQAARGKDCLTVADGGTGLGHQWAIIVFTKHW